MLFILFLTTGLFAQAGNFDDEFEPRGDVAVAEKYLLWAEDAIAADHWDEARAALERAVDFADISSDISYLLALARLQDNENRRSVLQALDKAIGTNRWDHYTEAHARLIEADQLIILRRYSAALMSLAAYKTLAGETADYAYLRLAALKGIADHGVAANAAAFAAANTTPTLPASVEFRRRMVEALDSYPRDPRFLRILFDYARMREPDRNDLALMEIALRRLPYLIELDPELAWMAAPFIGNDDEAGRLVAAYRAGSIKPRRDINFRPSPASLIPALNLGLIDDNDAIEELFARTTLDKKIIENVGKLLRSDETLDNFARRLHSFTGAIIDDEDYDGYPESRAIYHQGILQEYYYDADQDGIINLFISFISGVPQGAEIDVDDKQARILWERYPYVQRTVLGDETYFPAPGEFHFDPIYFTELGISAAYAGLLFPQRDHRSPGINRRMLLLSSVSVLRPSQEFKNGIEQIFLNRGTAVRSEVTLNGSLVSVTEFENGFPVIQRLDMDLDGRMETVRNFRRPTRTNDGKFILESVESDRYGGGLFGITELYQEDGSVVYLWDIDGTGNGITAPR